ncbi:MAG: hypothetical protein H8E25_13710 [Planctomycetes bacterium]|nr:hypothetical protein [Planctomycetota bacterium]
MSEEQSPNEHIIVDAMNFSDEPDANQQPEKMVDVADEKPAPTPEARPGSVRFLLGGMFFALMRPRVLCFLMLWSCVLPLIVAVPMFNQADRDLSMVQDLPGQNILALPESAPAWMFREWQIQSGDSLASIAEVMPLLILLSSIIGLLFSGGWMSMATHYRDEHSLRAFFKGGGESFFPFLRTWLIALPLFALTTYVFWGTPSEWVLEKLMPEGDASLAASETTGRAIDITRQVLYMLALLKIEIIIDLARASIVVGQRSSALLAVLRAIGFLFRRPFAVFVIVLLGFIFEGALIFGAEAMRSFFEWPLLAAVFLLPFVRHLMRGARHSAVATYYRAATGE